MSHSALRRHGLSLATTVVVGAMALAGCGAGQITQTATQVSAVDGASGTIGQVAIRNASIIFAATKNAAVYPAGGSAPLQMSVVNFGGDDDKLVSASSPVAGSVTITGDPRISSGRTLRISGGAGAAEGGSTASAAPSAGAGATPSAAPTASAAPTSAATSATAAASSAAASSAATTPTPSANGTTSASIVLSGLKQDIRAGLTYPVQFTFEKAGQITVQVPVSNPSEPRPAGSE